MSESQKPVFDSTKPDNEPESVVAGQYNPVPVEFKMEWAEFKVDRLTPFDFMFAGCEKQNRLVTAKPTIRCPNCCQPIKRSANAWFFTVAATVDGVDEVSYELLPCGCRVSSVWVHAFYVEVDRRTRGDEPHEVVEMEPIQLAKRQSELMDEIMRLQKQKDKAVLEDSKEAIIAINKSLITATNRLMLLTRGQHNFKVDPITKANIQKWVDTNNGSGGSSPDYAPDYPMPKLGKQVVDAVNNFTRAKMLKDGCYKRIQPLDVSTDEQFDKPVKIFDKEPNSPSNHPSIPDPASVYNQILSDILSMMGVPKAVISPEPLKELPRSADLESLLDRSTLKVKIVWSDQGAYDIALQLMAMTDDEREFNLRSLIASYPEKEGLVRGALEQLKTCNIPDQKPSPPSIEYIMIALHADKPFIAMLQQIVFELRHSKHIYTQLLAHIPTHEAHIMLSCVIANIDKFLARKEYLKPASTDLIRKILATYYARTPPMSEADKATNKAAFHKQFERPKRMIRIVKKSNN